ISGPTKAVTSTDPAVAMSRIRPRAPTGAPKVARIDGHAVPSIPSGSPRTTKLPRLSRSELRLAAAGRRCSPIGPCIRERHGRPGQPRDRLRRAGWLAGWLAEMMVRWSRGLVVGCHLRQRLGHRRADALHLGGCSVHNDVIRDIVPGPARRRRAMAMPSTDTDELAKFGYKQELDRSLGLFSSFAAGFSYISIMTGVFELFFFGFLSGGPAFIWTWPAVFVGQFLVALCFAELAGQFPLAGSVYQWSKQIAKPFTAFVGGWILTVGSIVTLAAVAVAYQVVAPLISSRFEIIGGPADIGQVATPGGAKNALLLAAVLVVFTTIINMVGVKVMARINNFGVAAELIGVTLLIILLAAHIRRGPGVILDTFNLGRGYPLGYFGAFLVAGLMSAYVMYGFDTAGSLAEETLDPRKNAPPAILRALAAAGVAGFLLILFGEMATPNIHASQLGTSGLPYLVKATLGGPIGNVFLIDSLIAITVCSLAVHAR